MSACCRTSSCSSQQGEPARSKHAVAVCAWCACWLLPDLLYSALLAIPRCHSPLGCVCSSLSRGKRRGPLSPAQEVGRALHRIIQAVEQDERQEQQQVAEVGERADLPRVNEVCA